MYVRLPVPARLTAARRRFLVQVTTIALVAVGLAGCGGKSPANTGLGPPVPVQAMPPIPDLSGVRSFPNAIPGVPTDAEGVSPPRLEQLGPLDYPPSAWERGLQGWAVYDFVVGRDGRVDERYVKLVATSDSVFVEPAMRSLLQSRFSPAVQGERTVAMLARLPIRFTLEGVRR